MGIRNLKFKKEAPSNYSLENEDKFIHHYGEFNCKILKAKSGDEIFDIMRKAYPFEEFDSNQIMFMNDISDKEVLVYVCDVNEDNPDIFVYPENNTPFTVDCFV